MMCTGTNIRWELGIQPGCATFTIQNTERAYQVSVIKWIDVTIMERT